MNEREFLESIWGNKNIARKKQGYKIAYLHTMGNQRNCDKCTSCPNNYEQVTIIFECVCDFIPCNIYQE